VRSMTTAEARTLFTELTGFSDNQFTGGWRATKMSIGRRFDPYRRSQKF